MSDNTTYYLGTNDKEIDRLALQHTLWRPILLSALARAGLSRGHSVLDAGAGPGFVSMDMADMVGPKGKVTAFERSDLYSRFLSQQIKARGHKNILVKQGDIEKDSFGKAPFDFIFVRWVFAFLNDPIAALDKLTHALKPGGRLIIFEYHDWGAMNFMPHNPVLDDVKKAMIKDWRLNGEIDAAKLILPALNAQGLHVNFVKPHFRTITPADSFWQWPWAFLLPHANILAERGVISQNQATAFAAAYQQLKHSPKAHMTTPLVMEMIAEKPL